MRGRNAILAVVILVGLGGLAWWLLRPEEEVVQQEDVEDDVGGPADLDEWIFDDSAPARDERPERASGARETTRERFVPDPNDPQWEARRQRRREQWRSRVDIAPLGENAPDIDPDAIGEALRENRPALRECIEESGGWRAMREARTAARESEPEQPPAEGERRRRGGRVVFDVRPDGTVDRDTLQMDPPMPEPFTDCFTNFFGNLELEGAGDGARVELPTRGGGGGRGRGGREGFSGDAGTQNRRSRAPR